MLVQAKVQLVRIQLQSATTCVLQLQRVEEGGPVVAPVATAVAEIINVPVDVTVGLKVGGVYTLTLSEV